jgi:hypothetical protein
MSLKHNRQSENKPYLFSEKTLTRQASHGKMGAPNANDNHSHLGDYS